MSRPRQPRMVNNVPRNYYQPNYRWPNPRGFNAGNQYFNPRPPNTYNEGEDYWCETCDRGFATVNLLEHHKQQHQKCNIDGCQFIAHPKVITKHIQMQHSSGLYKKIAKLDNPEEIKKWREERKKNFPTKLNIEKKVAEINEKNKRGEKMNLKYNRGVREDRNDRNFKSGTKRKIENQNNQKRNFKKTNPFGKFSLTKKSNSNHPPPKKIPKIISPLEDTRKLQPFTGIQNIVINDSEEEELQLANDILIEGDVDHTDTCNITSVNEPLNPKEPFVCSALTSLMCNYNSSDEDEIDSSNVKKKVITNVKSQSINQERKASIYLVENTNLNKQNINGLEINEEEQEKTLLHSSAGLEQDDDSGPEEVSIIKENNEFNEIPDKSKASVTNIQQNSKKLRHKYINTNARPRSKLPSTLLQKLLHKEIRHERNIILQCIRYIRKNNYFDKKNE